MSRIAPHISDNILDVVFHKYCYNNIFRTDKYGIKYILIPKELVIHDYYIESTRVYIKPGDYVRLSLRSPIKDDLLMTTTGLTMQELFDLTELHIKFTEDRPKCEYFNCHKPLLWSGKYSFGYGNSCRNWNLIDYHYCSRTCSGKDYSSSKLIGYGTLNNQVSSQYHEFLSYGSLTDECMFYIATTTNSKFKFGIASNITRFGFNGISNYKILLKASRLEVANLEAHIKLFRKSHKEYLDWDEVYSFRRAYIDSIDKLNIIPIFKKNSI